MLYLFFNITRLIYTHSEVIKLTKTGVGDRTFRGVKGKVFYLRIGSIALGTHLLSPLDLLSLSCREENKNTAMKTIFLHLSSLTELV